MSLDMADDLGLAWGNKMRFKRFFAFLAGFAMVLGITGVTALPALGSDQEYSTVVSATPANNTPHVLDGIVFSIAEVGDLIVLGGNFTQVQAASGGPVLNRSRIVAFNKNTGTISTSFNPTFNSTVRALVAAPDGNSIYVGGQFGTLNGSSTPKVLRLNITNGQRISQFNTGQINAVVHDINLVDDRLFFGGEFTTVAGQSRQGLAEVNATTGALSNRTVLPFTGQHRGGNTFVHKFDVDNAGEKLVATGNFMEVDGEDRAQVSMLDISGQQTTLADWKTDRWKPNCYPSFAYYLNDLDFAPDGSYFALSSMGGFGSGAPSLCDSISRWQSDDTGQNVNPVWVDYTGGDSVYAVEATQHTIYFGGHMRWVNNPFRADAAGQGAVGREGIGALSASNGMPIDWNPGRDRGRGVFDLMATEQGLWVGSDTDRIARYVYKGRIALFPLANGSEIPTAEPPVLPVDVIQAGSVTQEDDPRYLYRLNTGGDTIPSVDAGIDWLGDNTAPGSDYRSSGNNSAGYNAIASVTDAVPDSTALGIYSTERWDPSGDPRMEFNFPVDSGKNIEVRVYVSDRCTCTTDPGTRVYNIDVEGEQAFSNVDMNDDPGHDIGTMLNKQLVSDGQVTVSFDHVIENPAVNGIEIVDLDAEAPAPGTENQVTETYYNGSLAASKGPAEITGDVAWDGVRGGFVANDRMYLATSNGEFHSRSFNGAALGSATVHDLYGLSNFAGEMQQMSGLVFKNDRIYFTLSGQNSLFMRYFDLDSGIVGAERFTVATGDSGITWSNVHGMFLAEDQLYLANSEGQLLAAPWTQTVTDGTANGPTQVVSGPEVDGVSWTSRALISTESDGAPPLPNQSPTASMTHNCTDLDCVFSGAESTDPDGEIDSYDWDFGDGTTATGEEVEHSYSQAGDFEATLTVTDNEGATASTSTTVTVTESPNQAPEAAIQSICNELSCTFNGGGSTDQDGEIVTFSWTTSDGGSGDEAEFSYEFPLAGTYTVSLTVTDDDGATNTTEVDVEVSPTPNQLPEATFSQDCVFLSCTFDGTASNDPDGEIIGYSWSTDGVEVATGTVATYAFAAAGTYQVTLTVTDDSNETATFTLSVSVTADPGPEPGNDVSFVDSAANAGVDTALNHQVTIPSGVQEGDLMVAMLSTNNGGTTLGAPDGWETRADASTTSMSGAVYSKVAASSDAGTTLTVTTSSWVKGSLVISVYRDATVDAASFAMQPETSSGSVHTTPALTAQENSWLMSYWADKTATTGTWALPDSTVVRQTGAGSGAGHLSWMLADSNGAVSAGATGGLTATADSTTANAVMASVVLAGSPDGDGGGDNADPVAAFDWDCTFLSCIFDGTGSADPDGSLLEYAWTVEGSQLAVGESFSHSFPEAGSYTVSLEVADPAGATNTVSQTVEVEANDAPPPESDVAFVASAANSGTVNAMTHSVQIPGGVEAGDLMVGIFSTNQFASAPSIPSAWEQRAHVATASMQAMMFSKVATAADAGSTVNVSSDGYARGSLVVSVYRNATVSSASFVFEPEVGSTDQHKTPEAEAASGDWALSYWTDKTAATTAWQVPSTLAVRQTGAGSGAGHLSWMLADSGGPVSAGSVGNLIGVADSSTANAAMGTVVLGATD